MNSSSIGLILATATSISNVGLDVARKKALEGSNLLRTTFLMRITTASILTAFVLIRWGCGYAPHFWPHTIAPNFLSFMPPIGIYFFYILVDSSIIALVTIMYNRAIQASPLSLAVPFLAFTPVFLLGTGYVILGEIPNLIKCEGVLLVVLGSFLMHRKSFSRGLLEPLRVIFREPGSRYMLAISLLYSITNPIEKKLVLLSDSYTFSWIYAMMSVLILGIPILSRKAKNKTVHEPVRTKWIVCTGCGDALTIFLQLTALRFIDVVLCIALKRAGIILAVLAGWLVFREKNITDRLIAAAVMLVGALMVYLPISFAEQIILTAVTLTGLAIALFTT